MLSKTEDKRQIIGQTTSRLSNKEIFLSGYVCMIILKLIIKKLSVSKKDKSYIKQFLK